MVKLEPTSAVLKFHVLTLEEIIHKLTDGPKTSRNRPIWEVKANEIPPISYSDQNDNDPK